MSTVGTLQQYRERYQECIRMLNGLEKTLERKLPVSDRRWHVAEDHEPYGSENELCPPGWPPRDEPGTQPRKSSWRVNLSENFAENYTGLNSSVPFAENYIGLVLGNVDDGVSFDGVDGNVDDGFVSRRVYRFMPPGDHVLHPMGARDVVRFVNRNGTHRIYGRQLRSG